MRAPVHGRGATAGSAAWTRSCVVLGDHRFGAGAGGETAAQLLSLALAESTKGNYANKWVAFVSFCQASGYTYLPATTETVACYLGFIFERGTVAPATLQGYLTPINAVHALMQMERPAVGPLLVALRHGDARAYANISGGLRVKRVPLPAAALLRFANLGLTTADAGLRRRLAGLVMTGLTFSRPGGGANLRRKDVSLTGDSIKVQIMDYKHGARTDRERILINLPRRSGGRDDAPFRLVHMHLSAIAMATADGDQPCFSPVGDHLPLPTEVATVWMREAIYLFDVHPPDGGMYAGHSLRACAATSYRSIGGELDACAQLMGMKDKSTDVVSASYVDALVDADDAARELYDRYLRVRRRPAAGAVGHHPPLGGVASPIELATSP
ncbi:hypothetical protein I4F81_009299 [Pyropia yezoensis]|uniref:Uncharacterized protein n=1 Tax=Pyropia yezoensis TaxID=2788 RepID=A0ACC3CA15_PYRYE|nr:hypothetical protein I4F81_009299 [Neopyropia yezoensis]